MKLLQAIEGFIITISANGYSTVTIQYYQRNLQRYCKFLNNPSLETITVDKVREYFAHLRSKKANGKNVSESTIQVHWKCIRSFYNWASEELKIDRPDLTIKCPSFELAEVVPFEKNEIDKILKACHKSKRNTALLLLLLDTGLRVSEASRLLIKDVDLETGTVYIKSWQTGKKSRPRTVYLGKAARRAMWLYLASRDNPQADDPLLTTLGGKPLNRESIKNICYRLEVITGIHIHPHKFRHTFAIEYLRGGGDIFTLQRLLGHRSLVMVRHYLHLADSDSAAAHRRASPVDRWQL